MQKGTRVVQTLCSEGKASKQLPLTAKVGSAGPELGLMNDGWRGGWRGRGLSRVSWVGGMVMQGGCPAPPARPSHCLHSTCRQHPANRLLQPPALRLTRHSLCAHPRPTGAHGEAHRGEVCVPHQGLHGGWVCAAAAVAAAAAVGRGCSQQQQQPLLQQWRQQLVVAGRWNGSVAG